MVSYDGNPDMLRDHGNRFVCILFFLAGGVRGRPFDTEKVYSEIGAGAFNDKPQAIAELIQFLEREKPPKIQYNGGTNMVSLTDKGLEWAKECNDNPVFIQYRHLQN
jgi:hypothetical protein